MLVKSSRLARDLSRYVKRIGKAREKRVSDAKDRLAATRIRLAVFKRDMSKCRACGLCVRMMSPNPLMVGHAHHIEYRSAGGVDTLHNRALLCAQCHEDEHLHKLRISGNGNETLTIETLEHPRRVWESPCPS